MPHAHPPAHEGPAQQGHPHGHHPHGHHHGHDPGLAPGGGHDRAFAAGIALNLGFVAVEAFYGWRIDSLALLADAGHNLSDVAGLVLAWGGALAGRLRPDARHTYGWQRAGILAAFFNALLLLVAMGSLVWEAVHRLAAPPPMQGPTVMAVAGVGIVVNALTAALFARGREHDLNIRGAFWHMAADAMVSAGVVVAGACSLWFGWQRADPVVALVVAAFIVVATWDLFRQSLHLLFDGVPEDIDLHAVRGLLEALPGVTQVSDLHVWATSTTRTAMSAHLVMPEGGADDAFLELATRQLRDRFRIGHSTLQVTRAPFATGCGSPIGDNGRLSPAPKR